MLGHIHAKEAGGPVPLPAPEHACHFFPGSGGAPHLPPKPWSGGRVPTTDAAWGDLEVQPKGVLTALA